MPSVRADHEDVAVQVVTESTAIGAIGGLVGLTVGFFVIVTVTILARWRPVFDLRLSLVGLAAGIIFGIGSGLVPAIAASRIEPAQAVQPDIRPPTLLVVEPWRR